MTKPRPKPKRLTRKQMWERIETLSETVAIGSIAALVRPKAEASEVNRLADRQLTTDIWRWLLARQKKKDPAQLTFFKREDDKGIYDSLEAVPAMLLRKRSRRLRRWAEAVFKITDAIDKFLAKSDEAAHG